MAEHDPDDSDALGDPPSGDPLSGETPSGGTPSGGPASPTSTSSRREALVSFGFTTAVLLVCAVVAMGDAVTSCAGVVRGRPNDGTTGGVTLAWLWERTGGGPFTSVQHLTGGGLGDLLWRPLFVVNTLGFVPMWALTKLTSPVCAYNLTFVLGYVTSGWGMWALVRRLVGGRAVPAGAAVLFAFGAFPQMKAEWGHLSGVLLGLFPLLVLALLRLWERRTWDRVLVAGLCWGALPYVDGYHVAFSAILVAGALAGGTWAAWRSGAADRVRAMRERVTSTVLAGAVAGVLLVPWVAVLLTDFGAVDDQTERSADDAGRYGARVWEYVLPSPRHPLAPESYSTWRYEHMHRSNVAETAIGIGLVVIVLAVIGARSWSRRSSADPSQRTAASVLVGVAAAGFVCSLNPELSVLGVDLPMPADLVHAVLGQIRVFSRLVILVSTGAVALAAVGLHHVARQVPASRRALVVCGLVVASSFETLTFTPWDPPTWSYARTPAVFADLAADPSVDTVAMYPMVRGGEDGSTAFTYVPEMDKLVVNAFGDSGAVDDPVDVGRGIAALSDPRSLPVLRVLGTDVVVVLDPAIGADATVPDGLSLERTYECATAVAGVVPPDTDGRDCLTARVYRVLDGETAEVAVALGAGWGAFVPDGWAGGRVAGDGAQLEVVALSDGVDLSDRYTVQLRVRAEMPTTVRVDDGTGEFAEIAVGPDATELALVLPVGRTATLALDGDGEGDGDGEVTVEAIDVTPVAGG